VKLVIAGGTGSLGTRVAHRYAARGDEVVILTRGRRSDITHRQVIWDGRTVGSWADELDGSVLLNLAGELVDRRPTASNITCSSDLASNPQLRSSPPPLPERGRRCGCR